MKLCRRFPWVAPGSMGRFRALRPLENLAFKRVWKHVRWQPQTRFGRHELLGMHDERCPYSLSEPFPERIVGHSMVVLG